MSDRPRTEVGPGDYVLFVAFIVLWLIPMAYRGFSGRQNVPGMPRALNYLQNASCLFTDSVPSWNEFYVAGFEKGETKWR